MFDTGGTMGVRVGVYVHTETEMGDDTGEEMRAGLLLDWAGNTGVPFKMNRGNSVCVGTPGGSVFALVAAGGKVGTGVAVETGKS